MIFEKIYTSILTFDGDQISNERKEVLRPLIAYIQSKKDTDATIRLNFICTHNSRRSHLSQIWAQTMAHLFGIKNIFCYSGGTEATAMYHTVSKTLANQGFQILKLSESDNPIYAVKYSTNEAPLICFSKKYDSEFNPKSEFAAVMTCNNADVGCPIVLGAENRFPIKYDDPKLYDHTEFQVEKYAERSLEIALEMWWVFKSIN
ncbi:MAG: protein-tyrosine-phosphatase [Saprospiraceae bacterium]|nr:protein-tyrosine-phosphatase [Saprospiraceae bacterium]